MVEGDNTYPVFPSFLEGNRLQYDNDGLPKLQVFGNFPVGCSVGSLNYAGEERNPVMETMKGGGMEVVGSLTSQLKHPVLLNNKSFQDKVGHSGYALNAVSTGLRLSYEEDEHHSSVSCASEGIKASLPIISSLGDNLKVEIDQQKKELDCFIKFQEESIIKGLRELKQKHMISFLSAIEKGVSRKLYEKELEIESMNHKNKELLERVKQVSMEVQSWHYRAKYSESVVNVLRNNLQQVMAQGVMHGKKTCDSEIEDVASCTNVNYLGITEHDADLESLKKKKQVNCRACNVKEISVLMLPCRHLCLCKDCEVFIDVCPICGMKKTASVEVFMS
ncbi:E3 ubiquitin-protein ligase BOI-like [Senna tora]|uniref:E3 ubiquitin-protein ligase BOI-like n=1 Tax=Senna tora TaxID=362788 RepID=A0A835CDI1_9FABA|nr:E3 ubiquitin-protein ligase BOI-like [Senna tora]